MSFLNKNQSATLSSELDSQKRITRPPGGETNEIFNSPQSTPPSTPRKVKNYQQSNIFTPDYQGGEQRNVRHRPDDDSFKRLFGAQGADSTDSPRVKNNQKSSIIFADNGVATNGTNGHTNGHTNGTNGHSNGHTNGHSNGTNGTNGTTNGHHENGGSGSSTPNGTSSPSNGLTNGGSNGHVNGNSPKINGTNGVHADNGVAPGKRIPPGGFSSKLW